MRWVHESTHAKHASVTACTNALHAMHASKHGCFRHMAALVTSSRGCSSQLSGTRITLFNSPPVSAAPTRERTRAHNRKIIDERRRIFRMWRVQTQPWAHRIERNRPTPKQAQNKHKTKGARVRVSKCRGCQASASAKARARQVPQPQQSGAGKSLRGLSCATKNSQALAPGLERKGHRKSRLAIARLHSGCIAVA